MNIIYVDSKRLWPSTIGGMATKNLIEVKTLSELPNGLWCIHVSDWRGQFCLDHLGSEKKKTLIAQAKENFIAVLWYSGGELKDFNPGFGEKYPFIVPYDIGSEHSFFENIRGFITSASGKQEKGLTESLKKWIEQIKPSAVPEALVAAYLLLLAHEKIKTPLNDLTFNHWAEAGRQYQDNCVKDGTDWNCVSAWDDKTIGNVKTEIGNFLSSSKN